MSSKGEAINAVLASKYDNFCRTTHKISNLALRVLQDRAAMFEYAHRRGHDRLGDLMADKATVMQRYDDECVFIEHQAFAFGLIELQKLLSDLYDRAYQDGQKDTPTPDQKDSDMKMRKTPYGMNDRVMFGQYRGRLIKDIIKKDPKYIDWLWAVLEAEFTGDVWEALQKAKASTQGAANV